MFRLPSAWLGKDPSELAAVHTNFKVLILPVSPKMLSTIVPIAIIFPLSYRHNAAAFKVFAPVQIDLSYFDNPGDFIKIG